MKVAEVLSDLVSLRVCDHAAAMNLVSPSNDSSSTLADKGHTNTTGTTLSHGLSGLADEQAGNSADLQRALDLVDLHYDVKERYIKDGGNKTLEHARQEVARVLKTVK